MMEFNDNKPIYRQIVDYSFNCIIEGVWLPHERIPSVRELAAGLGVNTRTVLKAMDELQDLGVIIPQRGMGFLLTEDAAAKVSAERRKEFFQTTLPAIAEEMRRLGITPDNLLQQLTPYQPTNN